MIRINGLLFDFENLSDEVNLQTKFSQFSSDAEKFDKLNAELDKNKIDLISK